MKKVLSLVLVIAMVLSSMSFAFASTFEDVADSDYEVAIETMKALGVIDGFPDGTFRPEGALTRAQLAKLLVEALGFGGLTGGASNFSDTNGHWADSYIAIASGMGLVNGYPDGTFKPEGPVKYEEAYAMIIRALGYTDASLRGVWPTNYMVKALDLGLTDGLAVTNGPADRGGVAQVLYNALEAKFVQVDADNKVTPVEEGAETLIERLGELNDKLVVESRHLDPEDKAYKGNVVDLTPYMYQKLTVYENKDGVVVYVKSVDSLVLEGTVDTHDATEFKVEDAKEDVYTLVVGKDKNIENSTPVLLNGEEVDFKDVVNLGDAEVTVVLKGEDGDKISKTVSQDVIGIVAKLVTVTVQAEEDYKDGEVEILAFNDDVLLPVASKKVDFDRLVVKGAVDALEDIEEDDVLTLYYGKGEIDDDVKLEIVVTRDTVEGKVTRITTKVVDGHTVLDKVFVDGKSYSLNADFADEITVKDEGTFFLDFEGKLFSAETESDVTPANYALVLDPTNGYMVKQGDEDIVIREAKVKVLTAKGETVTYVLDHKALLKEGTDVVNSTLIVQVKEGDVIEYKLNKDGEVKEAIVHTDDLGFDDDVKTTVNSFKLAKNAALFGAPKFGNATDKTDGVKVVDAADLDKEIDGYFLRVDGEIVVIVVTKGAGVEEKIFGMITANSSITTDADGEEVVLYTAYVDGEKVEYLGLADEAKIDDLNKFGELTLSSGSLENIDTSINAVTGTAVKGRVTTSIKDTKGNVRYLADDVVVYVLKANGKFDKVGSKSDIGEKNFWLYDIYGDNDGDFDVVVVRPVPAP